MTNAATLQRWREALRDRVPPEYALEKWPVTQLLVVTVLLVYNAEIVVRLALGAPTVRVAIGYTFLNYPEVAWPLAPVLHRDALHLGANVLMLDIKGVRVVYIPEVYNLSQDELESQTRRN